MSGFALDLSREMKKPSFYLAHPRGGRIEWRLDSEPPQALSTREPSTVDRTFVIAAPDGPHALSLRARAGPRDAAPLPEALTRPELVRVQDNACPLAHVPGQDHVRPTSARRVQGLPSLDRIAVKRFHPDPR